MGKASHHIHLETFIIDDEENGLDAFEDWMPNPGTLPGCAKAGGVSSWNEATMAIHTFHKRN